jgi:hypothetical protein
MINFHLFCPSFQVPQVYQLVLVITFDSSLSFHRFVSILVSALSPRGMSNILRKLAVGMSNILRKWVTPSAKMEWQFLFRVTQQYFQSAWSPKQNHSWVALPVPVYVQSNRLNQSDFDWRYRCWLSLKKKYQPLFTLSDSENRSIRRVKSWTATVHTDCARSGG